MLLQVEFLTVRAKDRMVLVKKKQFSNFDCASCVVTKELHCICFCRWSF